LQRISRLAKELNSAIAVGTLSHSESRWVNRTLVFGCDGELSSSYDKTHLTDMEADVLGLSPGIETVLFEQDQVRFGFAVCFDQYFSEYFSELAANKVDVIICPTYQRSESPDRIYLISRARAFDSGAYILRSSYSMDSSPKQGGHSLVAGPDGDILADAGCEAGMISVEIDPKMKFIKPASHGQGLIEHRELIETHRRPCLYRYQKERSRPILESGFPRLCAHRGISKACPENTLPAFGAAIGAGAHEIEFDLWLSRDGVPVVCHDPDVQRTTNGNGILTEMDWEDICRLDAGTKYGDMWQGISMPRFEEVIELADGVVGMNIHIKNIGPDGRLVKLVCDTLLDKALIDTAYIAGDSEEILQAVVDYAPEVPRACLINQSDPVMQVQYAKKFKCSRIQFGRNVTADNMRPAHDAGIVCNLFWSDEPEDARTYVENGIDVILSNCVHKLVAGGFLSRTNGDDIV